MFDESVYSTILQASYTILKSNGQKLGKEFCEGFMFDYDPRNGQASLRNAETLFNYVAREAQRLNNSMQIRDEEQLFGVVGFFIENIFNRYQSSRRGSMGGGMGFGGNAPSSGFGGGFQGGSMFSQNRSSLGFGQQNPPPPTSHLIDDVMEPGRPISPPPSQSTAPTAMSFAAPKPQETIVSKYVANPFDDLSNTGIEFNAVPAQPTWGEELPTDRRIVVSKREILKTRDEKYTINRCSAYHQVILNDQMDVVKDFFDCVPDSTLGSPFLFKIGYNHLDVLEVPTQDFVEIRQKCIDAVTEDPDAFLHKKIMEVLGTMRRDPWKAMTTYLTQHINRALHLSARLSTNPKLYLQIGEFDDLNDLLSSSFKHSFTTHPEGRHQLEKIVASSLWNALAMNSTVLFGDNNTVPTHAIQSSPAFPFSMEGVYPNKFAIPLPQDAMAETFVEKFQEHELTKRSYVVSKRSVVITNILGRYVLPEISKDPKIITNSVASLLNSCIIPYTKISVNPHDVMTADISLVSETHPSDQLEAYYEDPKQHQIDEIENYGRKKPNHFPIDQSIFAVQYGMSPMEYLMALDVFSTIDTQTNSGQTILAKKTIPSLTTTA